MTAFALLSIALLSGTAEAAQEQASSPPPQSRAVDLAKEKVRECAGEKFVFAWGAGAHPTKVTLCSDRDASTEQVIRMIGDAADKIEAAPGIPEDRRTALVQQMRAKIAELEAGKPPTN